jgi:anaerobic magnesium-protoporphyrin IX monomethyl ester cyclase
MATDREVRIRTKGREHPGSSPATKEEQGMIDCLIIGQNDIDFEQHIKTLKFSFGRNSGVYQDQDLTFITHKKKPYRALDFLTMVNSDRINRPLTNTDFLWPTILVLGSFLDKHGMTFDYINQFHLEHDRLHEKMTKNKYLMVAITTTLYVTDSPIKDIVKRIRQYDKDVLIIVGGPYIKNRLTDSLPERISREFDGVGGDIYVNSSEGQVAMVRVIEALKAERSLASTPNLIYRTAIDQRYARLELPAPAADVPLPDGSKDLRTEVVNGFAFTEAETEYNALEENPIDYSLFPKDEIGAFLSLATAKSCPYRCSFCSFPSRAGAYTYLDVDAVERELHRIRELGVETLTFLDDTFNVPKKRFKELLRMMIRNNFGFKWNSFYRSDQGDEETIELMAESGCEGVFLGIESASDKMLEAMEKTSRKKHYAAAIPLLTKNGIYSHANFIVGFPGETMETAMETMDFVQEMKPTTYKAQLWYADNTSPVWKRREELGIEGIGFSWSHHSMNWQQAAEIIDHMHQNITESVFLPQDGFGMWCMFYLQRKGMSMRQILDFLRLFADEVKRKRLDPDAQETPAETIARLFEIGRIKGPDSTAPGQVRQRLIA